MTELFKEHAESTLQNSEGTIRPYMQIIGRGGEGIVYGPVAIYRPHIYGTRAYLPILHGYCYKQLYKAGDSNFPELALQNIDQIPHPQYYGLQQNQDKGLLLEMEFIPSVTVDEITKYFTYTADKEFSSSEIDFLKLIQAVETLSLASKLAQSHIGADIGNAQNILLDIYTAKVYCLESGKPTSYTTDAEFIGLYKDLLYYRIPLTIMGCSFGDNFFDPNETFDIIMAKMLTTLYPKIYKYTGVRDLLEAYEKMKQILIVKIRRKFIADKLKKYSYIAPSDKLIQDILNAVPILEAQMLK